MLRVIRNHKRAADGLSDGYEKLSVAPTPLDHASLIRAGVAWAGLSEAAKRLLGRRADARPVARLPQRASLGDRPDRHDRPGDGLRHHRHRARFRAGQIQEAGRRRLFQDHQPRRPRGPSRPRLRRSRRSPRSSPTPSATPRSARRPASTSRACAPRVSPTPRSPRSRPRSPAPSTSSSSSTNGRSAPTSSPRRSKSPPKSWRSRASICSPRSASPNTRSRPPTPISAAR